MLRSNALTIGQLSRRTGVPIKVLRHYEDLGFLYTLGRSESNYRLFGEEVVWCVQVIQGLRSLGLTLKEIQALVTCYLERPGEPSGVLLEAQLAQALPCNLPLDSPAGGRVYTLFIAVHGSSDMRATGSRRCVRQEDKSKCPS